MTQLFKVKQNIHQHKDKSCNLKNKKTNSRPNRAVWTVFVNCSCLRGSTLAIYKTVMIIFPLNLQTITITLDVVKWRWGGKTQRWIQEYSKRGPSQGIWGRKSPNAWVQVQSSGSGYGGSTCPARRAKKNLSCPSTFLALTNKYN